MSSIHDLTWTAYDASGAQLAGLAPTWKTCRDVLTGSTATTPPTIDELGDGVYCVRRDGSATGTYALAGLIDCGPTAEPIYQAVAMSSADLAASATDARLPAAPATEATAAAAAPAATALSTATWTGTKAGYLDAAVSSRLADADYTAPDNAGIAAIKAQTDGLPADPASETTAQAALDAALAAQAAAENVDLSGVPAAVWSATTRTLTSHGQVATDAATAAAQATEAAVLSALVDARLPAAPASAGDVAAVPAAVVGATVGASTLGAVLSAAAADASLARRLSSAGGAMQLDSDTGVLTVYDDDGTTPLRQFQMLDRNGADTNGVPWGRSLVGA